MKHRMQYFIQGKKGKLAEKEYNQKNNKHKCKLVY